MATTAQATAPNLDKSLDDNRRGGSNRDSARRNIVGGPRVNGSLTRTPRPSPPAVPPAPAANLGTKIIISNLPTDVAEGDVTELFAATVGAVRECQINYARDGRSKGSATVTFVRAGDATKAYNQYNNRLIDGTKAPGTAKPEHAIREMRQVVIDGDIARSTAADEGTKVDRSIEVVVDLAHPVAPSLAQRVNPLGAMVEVKEEDVEGDTAEEDVADVEATTDLKRQLKTWTLRWRVKQRMARLQNALGPARTPSPAREMVTKRGSRVISQSIAPVVLAEALGTPNADGQSTSPEREVSNSPTSSASNVPSLAPSTSSISTIESTATSSPRPEALKLGLPFEQHTAADVPEKLSLDISRDAEENFALPVHEESKRNSNAVSVVSTPDHDRFSNIQLATPTSTDSSPRTAIARRFSPTPERKRATRNFTIMPPLHDDEADVTTTTHAGGDDPEATQPSINQNHALSIQTDMEAATDDPQQTPVAGSSDGSKTLSPNVTHPPASSPPNPPSSGGGVDFLLARLEKAQEDPTSNRRSLEVREKLKEDFQRLQATNTSPLKGNFPHKLPHEGTDGPGGDEKTDWEFWGDVIANYEHVARTQPQKLAGAIHRGIPSSLRGMVWQLMSTSKDVDLEHEYAQHLKDSSPHEKSIIRDLGRTFPQHAFFMDGQGLGQENLFNVLKAYSLYDPEVGYCQGLAFIGAALLLNMPDEEAFCVLVRLMHSYGLRDMFVPEMPGLQLRLFQFDRLVEELLPVVHVHFVRQGVKSSIFPLDLVFRIFDSVFGHGVEAIFGFSLTLLMKNEETLLKLKFDNILEYMKGELFDIYRIPADDQNDTADRSTDARPSYRADEFVQDAFDVRITPFMLDNFAAEWAEIRRVANAHAVELDNLRTANRAMAAQMRALETSLSTLNAEHCELVKELVMSKIEREEVESELVRYKLLYAEVMHDKEDAMSSQRMSAAPATAHATRGSSQSSLSLSFPSFGRGS
ncbi:GTPase-activating protein [Tulasnella sp. 331]|nr:GTPase-activating protein [Tulasnella sp. 331]